MRKWITQHYQNEQIKKMEKNFSIEIPLKVLSEANTSGSWQVRYNRAKKQKKIIKMMLARCDCKPPCLVKLIRISPRKLDSHDNLPASFKFVIDAISDYLIPGLRPGFADGSEQIKWEFDQEKGEPKTNKIRIEIYEKNQPDP
jgi:hypothetical protein